MKSMTGYGRAREQLDGKTITVELRAVNHRYLDCTVKAPRQYGFLDEAVKKAAASRISRGKVEVFVGVEVQEGGDVAVTVNHALAERYLDALHEIADKYGLRDDVTVTSLAKTQTALMQNSIAAEFNRIHEWEKQYNSYLKTANGYASSLKACTHLYNDGVRIFLTLGKLGKAIGDNPQGIVASMNMNNLYIETATELVSVFTLLNDAVAKGGTENMLTGAERSKTLWALNDQLEAFSRKLHLLYLSLRYYTLNDVWNNITAGMIDRSNGEVARLAMSRWRRAAAIVR